MHVSATGPCSGSFTAFAESAICYSTLSGTNVSGIGLDKRPYVQRAGVQSPAQAKPLGREVGDSAPMKRVPHTLAH